VDRGANRAALAWLGRNIAFEHRPIGEVAEEFNRNGRVPIELDDQEMRPLPISGVFDAYDTDSFASFLGTLDGVQVEKTPTRIVFRRLAAATREAFPIE
jgi:ferric-dicitrate binding protein FerR (iron transport regulator)